MKRIIPFPKSLSEEKIALLLAVLNQEISEEDPLFIVWLHEKKSHEQLYHYLRERYSKQENTGAHYDKIKDRMWQNILQANETIAPRRRHIMYKPLLKYAAVLTAILGFGTIMFFWATSPPLTEIATGNTIDSIALKDGSMIVLGKHSKIQFVEDIDQQKQRHVTLNGEAFFKVRTNNTPFIVNTRYASIEVMGTEFIVEANDAVPKATASLLTGKIKFSKKTVEGNPVFLKPGDKLRYDVAKDAYAVNQVAEEWRTYPWAFKEVHFHNAPLGEILELLSHWHGLTIKYADTSLKQQRFNIYLQKDRPVSETLRLIGFTHKATFVLEGKELLVRGNN